MASCIREEIPVDQFDRGGQEINTISIGSDYGNQVWYQLDSTKVISENTKTDWELAFDMAEHSSRIWLNTSLVMQACITQDLDIVSSSRPAPDFFRPDHPSGVSDSLALANLAYENEVIWIDLGFDISGTPRGYATMIVNIDDNNDYVVNYKIGDQPLQSLTVSRDEDFNRKMVSLINNKVVEVEPKANRWDLVFTQYTEIFYDPFLPYLVVGVLSHPGVLTAQIDNVKFDDVNLNTIDALSFKPLRNVIGYDWKTFSFDESLFIIEPDRVYVIKDIKGFLYKLQFLDFYDDIGQRGQPSWKIERM